MAEYPYLLPGTKAAAKRLWEAIQKSQRIMIHGDYDTDGITATALLAWVLRENGAIVSCYLPHRIDDGYGLTADSINKNAKGHCDLLVTVDCGITSYDAVDAARASQRKSLFAASPAGALPADFAGPTACLSCLSYDR